MGIMEILTSLAKLLVMILVGIILKRGKVLNENQTKGLSSIVLFVTWPCIVIDAMQIPYSKEILHGCLYMMLLAALVFAGAFLFSLIAVKVFKMEKSLEGLFTFMLVFGATAFVGLPVTEALYGREALFYAAIVEMVNDIFMFTVGMFLIQSSAGAKKRIDWKAMISPGFVGVIIGFILFLTDTTLPSFLGEAVSMIGGATSPLIMMVIGSQLAEIKVKELIGDRNAYLAVFGKLVVVPMLAFVITRLLFHDDSLLGIVLILSFAMPTATGTTAFAHQYDADVTFATKGVLLSTVLCIITIPLFAMIL